MPESLTLTLAIIRIRLQVCASYQRAIVHRVSQNRRLTFKVRALIVLSNGNFRGFYFKIEVLTMQSADNSLQNEYIIFGHDLFVEVAIGRSCVNVRVCILTVR